MYPFIRSKKHLFVWLALFIVFTLAPTSRAQTENQAGLVVQFSDGSIQTFCISFMEGSISGYDLLSRSGLAITARFDAGLGYAVCRINEIGCPVESCLDCPDSLGRYWSYWRLLHGNWNYSGLGASNTQIRHGEVDGWRYGINSPPQEILSFEQICSPPTSTPTRTASPSATFTSQPTPSTTPTFTKTPKPLGNAKKTRVADPTSTQPGLSTTQVDLSPDLTAQAGQTLTPAISLDHSQEGHAFSRLMLPLLLVDQAGISAPVLTNTPKPTKIPKKLLSATPTDVSTVTSEVIQIATLEISPPDSASSSDSSPERPASYTLFYILATGLVAGLLFLKIRR